MWGPGGISSFIRFICHIPTGMLGFNNLSLYQGVRNLGDIYDVIPYGRDLLQGMKIVTGAGIATFAWNFFQFMASTFCRGILLGLVGLVDATLAGLLILGVVWQARFLPGTYDACKGGATQWSNGTDGRNFFVVASQVDDFKYDDSGRNFPDKLCHSMVENWVMAIVVITFYLICAIVNILIGFGDAIHSGPGTKRSWGSFPAYDVDIFSGIFSPLLFLLHIWKPVFYISNHIQAPVHMALRYMSKYLTRNKGLGRAKAKEQEWEKVESGNVEKKPLLQPYGTRLPNELVIMIARNLHYADLVNLNRSSKGLRAFFFGEDHPLEFLRDLRQYACDGRIPKSQCALCRVQTCSGCQTPDLIPQSNAFQHLTQCLPVCSKCFYRKHCLWNTTRPSPARDIWGSVRVESRWDKIKAEWKGRRSPNVTQDLELLGGAESPTAHNGLCQICAVKLQDEKLAALEAQNMYQVQRLARLPLACSSCREILPATGVRWWVGWTGRECTWHGHPNWMQAMRGAKDY